jgi:hypothetical protein
MRKTPDDGGSSQVEKEKPRRAAASGVRTEHDLRVQLRDALERNTKFERALRESVAFAYGRRELADLRRLKAVLWAAGFPDPSPKSQGGGDDGDAEAEPPAPAAG